VTLDLDAVDALFTAEHDLGRSPGLVYAVVRDGEVLHVRGLGTTAPDAETAPRSDSVQRIASMTKSFTATAVLLLRDRGLLRLDDAVSAYVADVPEALTIRHLITMSGGLLTDDPWGDRNESQTTDELAAFLAGGFPVGAEPGTTFEYSNLGYALLGRVIDAVHPAGFRALVLDEVTGPLGMAATSYDVRDVGPALVRGHHDHGDGWTVVPDTVPGTFSAMGGLHSTLTDLARWVGGFTDAFRRPDAPHPLTAASRREMQQLQRFAGVSGALAVDPPAGGAALSASATGYGFGLFVEHHSDHGTVVHHSGGYPGYGSHMRWHPETGLGVIGLANGTYAAPGAACRDALRALVASERVRAVPPAATPALVAAVTAKLAPAEEPVTDDLFTFNVPLDVPEDVRRRQLDTARGLVGPVSGPAGEPYADGLGAASWSVPAERGRLDVDIKVAPTAAPAVQSLKVTAVPDAPPALAERAVEALGGADAAATIARALGEPAIAGVLAGDGEHTATFAVRAGTTWWRLVVSEEATTLTACSTGEYPRLEHRFPA
jgi:CubicO group peptidase (beta-lactamase class C family)